VHPAPYYEEHGIELLTGRQATSLDMATSSVTLAGGEPVAFDKLLLCTGAEPRVATMPGADLDGIHHLRTAADSDALRARLPDGGRVVVVGGGWIGCEVAASAVQMGATVTLIEQSSTPLGAVIGERIGRFFCELHSAQGVRLITGVPVDHLEGSAQVEVVELADGTRIEADVVVFGIGVLPRTGLAESAGFVIDNGIAVDETLRTSAPDVFAAGDVANAINPRYGRRVRTEHWANAGVHGALAARSMLGRLVVNDGIPFFFSDQYDVGLEYRGLAARDDELVVRGDPADREFVAFWLRGGRLAAALNVNVWDVGETVERLIASGVRVSPDELADPAVPLETATRERVR
jgi:3-phenylpropionate/trans-cinnamate dioxygenase ferredoxin reductase subunit